MSFLVPTSTPTPSPPCPVYCHEYPKNLANSETHLFCDECLLFFACIREDSGDSNYGASVPLPGRLVWPGRLAVEEILRSQRSTELLLCQTAGCLASVHSRLLYWKPFSCRCSAKIFPPRLGWTSICTWKLLRVISSLMVVQTAVTPPSPSPTLFLSHPPFLDMEVIMTSVLSQKEPSSGCSPEDGNHVLEVEGKEDGRNLGPW